MSYVIYINRGIYFGSSGSYNLAYEVCLLDKWVSMFIWLCECPLWLNVCHGKTQGNTRPTVCQMYNITSLDDEMSN